MREMDAAESPLGRLWDEEAELVQQAKLLAPLAWRQIYDAHYPQLYRYAMARTGDRAVAEDIAASVFLEAVKGIGSYSYRGRPLLAWLYRIARNLVSDHLKAQRPAAPLVEADSVASQPEGGQEASLLAARLDLQAALQRLSEEQREVVALRYIAGFSTPEVAKILGKRERAVYSLQARALAALRRYLDVSPE